MSDDKPLADRLRDLFEERFGLDWRKELSLTLRADVLFWLVHLAERGIEARRQGFKADKSDPAGAAASLASWTMDLEALVEKVAKVLPPKKGKK